MLSTSAVNGPKADLVHYEQDGVGYGLYVGDAVLHHPITNYANNATFAENEEVLFLLWRQVLTLQNEGHISCANALSKFVKIIKF